MPGIGVVLNPYSRSNRKNPGRIGRLAFIVGDKGSCRATHDFPDLDRVAQEFAARDIEILGISGGDGTIHHTISAFISAYGAKPLPMIALLRGGTINNVSNAIGIQGTPESILSRIILKYHESEPFETTPIHCIDVNGRYGFLVGNGMVANFVQDYVNLGEGGARAAFLLFARGLGAALFHTRYIRKLARRFDAEVLVDGERLPYRNYTLVHAGTVEPYGFGIRPFYRAREQPEHFHLAAYSMPPRDILKDLPRIWQAKAPKSPHYIDRLAKCVEVRMTEPLPFMIDGEMYPPTDHLTLRCAPALTMIRR